MGINLGSAYGKVSLDARGLKQGVTEGISSLQKLQKVGMQVGGVMESIGRSMTIGVTLPILAMGAASIKAASDFEETKNKAVVVFGEMSNSVISNANKASTALGLSKTQYLDYASSIAAALTAGGMGIKESAELAEGAVKHFADLASFHNARVEDVAVAWQSAIRGQYEPIQRYFPFITNEYLKTYGIANGLIDANTKQLTANQRAIILNAIALDEQLNPAIDDFSETAGGLANQTRAMKAQFQDALILLGQNLLPMALQFVGALNQLLTAFNNLSPGQQKILIGFAGLLAIAGPVIGIIGKIITAVTALSTLFGAGGMLAGAGTALAGIGTAISGVVIPAIGALAAALAPILLILAAVAATAYLIALALTKDFLFIRSAFQTTVKIGKALWAAFTAFLRGDTDAAMGHIAEAFAALGEHVNKVFQKVFGIKDAWQSFITFLRNAMTNVVKYISDSMTRIDWKQVGKYILFGIANGMLLGLPNLLLTAKKIAEQLLAQIKKSLGISSPSAEAMKLGLFTAQGFQMGLNRVSPDEMARSLVRPITNASSSQQQTIIQHFSSGLTLSSARQMISENNEQLINTIIGALS